MSEQREPLSPLERAEMERAVTMYERGLRGSVRGVQALTARGLTRETVERFRFGVVIDPAPGHERYRGMLAIPYLSGDDRHPVTVRFRCLEDHDCKLFRHGKYQSLSGDKGRMFNVPAILESDPEVDLHVCEGEIDVATLSQLGYAAVGFPGASTFRAHHAVMLAGAGRVHVWGDGDKAGREFSSKVKSFLKWSAMVVPVPDGEDVNSVFVRDGAEGVERLLERG